MTEDYLNYGELMEGALKSVVRSVLSTVAADGLSGTHHFYLTFRTGAAGVEIPDFLLSQFPDEMTIVLQHQFWDLEVGEDRFSVALSFNNTPAHLDIPYDALTAFVDPSVNFGLQFGGSDTQGPPLVVAEVQDSHPATENPAAENVVALDQFRKNK